MNDTFQLYREINISIDLSKEDVMRNTISKWGHDVGGKMPSCSPRGESVMKIFKANPKKDVVSSEFVNFARDSGLCLCNTQGLYILELTDVKENLLLIEREIELWVYGYDYNECLHFHGGYQIPFFKKNSDGTYAHQSCSSNFVVHIDQLFVAFEKL